MSPANSSLLYEALRRRDVPAELHVFSTGGHAFGVRDGTVPGRTWPMLLAEWLGEHGLIN